MGMTKQAIKDSQFIQLITTDSKVINVKGKSGNVKRKLVKKE